MQQLAFEEHPLEVVRLEQAQGVTFQNLTAARERSASFRERFEDAVKGLHSDDATIVCFGSLARSEFTAESDVDWTVLVDGIASPKHLDLAHQVRGVVESLGAKPPGPEAIFGNIAFSHAIIHQIGGEDDTNRNTTQRILLALESRPVSRRGAYDRVLNQVLARYVEEDARFLETDAKAHVPRFLLNDFARYWRTMAVDFAYKRRTRGGEGAVLRNLKLRMSRKLIFVSGLLACFSFDLLLNSVERETVLKSILPASEFVRHMRRFLSQTPLEILARVVNHFPHLSEPGVKLFAAYDHFLGSLSDKAVRDHLKTLRPGREAEDTVYRDLQHTSHEFRDHLLELFFDEKSGLARLTRTYGVF